MIRTIIDNHTNRVVNIVVADDEFAPPDGCTLGPAGGNIGETWDAQSQQYNPAPQPPRVVTSAEVNDERERRIAAGCTVTLSSGQAIPVDTDELSLRNVQGLQSVALVMQINSDAGTIAFRDRLNQMHDLTAAETTELALQVAAFVQSVYAASWTIKALDPIPTDYADDAYWTGAA